MIKQHITKSQVVSRIGEKMTHLPLEDINAGVNILLQHMRTALIKKQPITLRGLGTFYFRRQSKRKLYNMQTGKTQTIEARDVLRFKPGKILSTLEQNTRAETIHENG